MASSSRLRFDIEDAPSDADVEVLPNGLEAFNESPLAGPSAMAAACRVRARAREHRRGARG